MLTRPQASLPFILGLLLGTPALAQQAPSPPAAQSSPRTPSVLRATTRLVQVSVVVQDKKGNPVPGLKKTDFSLQDEGVPQEIAFFSGEFEANRPAKPVSVPANIFSNRFEQAGHAPGAVTAILLDMLNTSFEDQSYARNQAIKFLQLLRPQDHVAIYVLTSRLSVLQDFTSDSSALLRALEQYKGYSSQRLDAANPAAIELPNATSDPHMKQLQDFLNSGMGRISDVANESRANSTSEAILAIANHVSRIPGRKNLLWVSGSFPLAIGFSGYQLTAVDRSRADFSPELLRAARAVNQVNMAIYPVDARGMMTGVDITAPATTSFDRAHLPTLSTPDEMNFDSMVLLADRTGGKAFHNSNDFSGALLQALADSESSYTLSFYPSHGKWDGKFHELKVRSTVPGINLRYRKGYFAAPDQVDSEAEGKAALNAASYSPVESTGFDVAVEVTQLRPSSKKVLKFVVGLDVRQLMFREEGNHRKGKLNVVLVQLDAENKSLYAEPRTIDLNYTAQEYNALLRTGITLTRNLPMEPKAAIVRVLVRDTVTGAMGTVTVPVGTYLSESAGSAAPAASRPKN
jgi:VWFA-related protein